MDAHAVATKVHRLSQRMRHALHVLVNTSARDNRWRTSSALIVDGELRAGARLNPATLFALARRGLVALAATGEVASTCGYALTERGVEVERALRKSVRDHRALPTLGKTTALMASGAYGAARALGDELEKTEVR